MIDLVGAIFGSALYAVLVGVLVGCSPAARSVKIAIAAVAAVWGTAVVGVAALGGFGPGVTGPVPAVVFPFAGSLALLFGGWFLSPEFRNALLSISLPAFIWLNAGRLGGVFFLILAAHGRLPAPFAPTAGLGDMLVGALAIPLALAAIRASATQAWLGGWNALGALDLIVAVSLGVLSAPGTPFRVFTEGPGTAAMGSLPWVMIPGLLVPLYLLIHIVIAARLHSRRPTTRAVAMAG